MFDSGLTWENMSHRYPYFGIFYAVLANSIFTFWLNSRMNIFNLAKEGLLFVNKVRKSEKKVTSCFSVIPATTHGVHCIKKVVLNCSRKLRNPTRGMLRKTNPAGFLTLHAGPLKSRI